MQFVKSIWFFICVTSIVSKIKICVIRIRATRVSCSLGKYCRAFALYLTRKIRWDTVPGCWTSWTRVSHRHSAEIHIKWAHFCRWTRFLLPDMFVHVLQVLFHCLAGCIDLLGKLTQQCRNMSPNIHFQLLLKPKVAQGRRLFGTGRSFDALVIV